MTLYFDMQTRQLLLLVPPGAEGRERQTVTIATLFEMIEDQEIKAWPKWKRYYYRHKNEIVEHNRAYREKNCKRLREHNREYKRAKRRKEREALLQEAVSCSS